MTREEPTESGRKHSAVSLTQAGVFRGTEFNFACVEDMRGMLNSI